MDKQEYLNQISAENKPVKPQNNGFLGKVLASKITWLVAGAVGLFVLIAIIGAVLGGSKGGVKEKSYALTIRISNTMGVMDNYQKMVKSSGLRGYGTSLYSIFADTNRDISSYLVEKYKIKESDIKKNMDQKTISELDTERDGLEADLFEAKINGNLDRIYAHKLAYEASIIMNEENKIRNSTGDDALKEIITKSYNSLENLYDKINNFSEAK